MDLIMGDRHYPKHNEPSYGDLKLAKNCPNVYTPIDMGTTIMAVSYQGGVVIGADSRTSSGIYISNRVSDKLTPLHDNIICLRSGSAADTQAVADIVKYDLEIMAITHNEHPRVKVAANLVKNICYNYRDSLAAGIIVAGWDKYDGGQVYSVPLGGMIVKQPYTLGGSGSTYVYGFVDSAFQPGMTENECLKFVTCAVALAMSRDGSSGGVIRLASINKDGIQRHSVAGENIPQYSSNNGE